MFILNRMLTESLSLSVSDERMARFDLLFGFDCRFSVSGASLSFRF